MATRYCKSTGTDSGLGTNADPYSLVAANAAIASGLLASGELLMLDIYGGGTELSLTTPLLVQGSSSIVVRCAQIGAQWVARMSKLLPAGTWTKTGGFTNIYQNDGEQEAGGLTAASIAWENATPYTRLLGAHFSDVSVAMDAAAGTTWTGPTSVGDPTVRTYVHSFVSTDPRADGKIYERSQVWNDSASSAVVVQGGTVDGCVLLGLIWRGAPGTKGTGTNGYGFQTIADLAGSVVSNSSTQTGDKHCFGNLNGVTNGSFTFSGCLAGLLNPYANDIGSVISFVGYADDTGGAKTGIVGLLQNCGMINGNNVGLIGSAAGTIDRSQPATYFHNAGSGTQFGQCSHIGCNFPSLLITAGAPASVPHIVTDSRFGSASCTNATISRCYVDYQGIGAPASTTINVDHTIYVPAGPCNNTVDTCRVRGTINIDHCLFDMRGCVVNNSALWNITDANGNTLTITNSVELVNGADFGGMLMQSFTKNLDHPTWNNNMVLNPLAATANNGILMYTLTGYTGSTLTTATMKTNGIANAASQEIDSATIANYFNSAYRPVAATTVRSTTGDDVGRYKYISPVDSMESLSLLLPVPRF